MPPRDVTSRYAFAEGLTDDEGRLYLTIPHPYRYRDLADNIEHPVRDGETVMHLAGRYYGDSMLYDIICNFQPDPIHDATVAIPAGTVLILPSKRTVDEEILNEKRRDDATG